MSTPLDTLRAAVAALDGPLSVLILPSDPESQRKLASLRATGRDFLAVTPELIAQARRSLETDLPALAEGGLTEQTLLAHLGDRIRDAVVKRFTGPSDAPLRPLSPATIARKGSDRVGVATGDLLRSLQSATVRVTRDYSDRGRRD